MSYMIPNSTSEDQQSATTTHNMSSGTRTRRRILVAIGGVGTAGLGNFSHIAGAQKAPTVTVSTPECETLRFEYSDAGPPVELTISGPDTIEITLDRGESKTVHVTAGEYDVEARPRRSSANATVSVEGSPVTVEPCDLIATLDCNFDSGGRFRVTNPLSICTRIFYEVRDPDDDWLGGGNAKLDSGNFMYRHVWPQEHQLYWWAYAGCEGDGSEITINGESLLHLPIAEDCEALKEQVGL